VARKVWTVAELEVMTPQERHQIFEGGIIRNLDEVPPSFLAKVRARTLARIEAEEGTGPAPRD
jgi:hypothetical protein